MVQFLGLPINACQKKQEDKGKGCGKQEIAGGGKKTICASLSIEDVT